MSRDQSGARLSHKFTRRKRTIFGLKTNCPFKKVSAENPESKGGIQAAGIHAWLELAKLLQHPCGLVGGGFVDVRTVEYVEIMDRADSTVAKIDLPLQSAPQQRAGHADIFTAGQSGNHLGAVFG